MALGECSEAVAHQGSIAISQALSSMYKGDLVGVTTLEAIQELCSHDGVFTSAYGVVPTKSGVNAFRGPGEWHKSYVIWHTSYGIRHMSYVISHKS